MKINYQNLVRDFLISLHCSGTTEISIKEEDINFYLPILKGVLSKNNISYNMLTSKIDPNNELSESAKFRKLIIKNIIDHKEIGWIDDDHTKIIFDQEPIKGTSYIDGLVKEFNSCCKEDVVQKPVVGTSLETKETKTLVLFGRNYNPILYY